MRTLSLLAAVLIAAPAAAAAGPKAEAAADIWARAGLARLEARDPAGAIAYLERAARAKPEARTYFLLGWAHYQRGFSGKAPEEGGVEDALAAAAAFEKALALDPELASVSQRQRLHFSLAVCREAARDHEGAMLAYKAAFKAAPGNAMIPLYAARLRQKMGMDEKASADVAVSLDRARALGKLEEVAALIRGDRLFKPLLKVARVERLLAAAAASKAAAEAPAVAMQVPAAEELRDAVRDTKPKVSPERRALDAKLAEAGAQDKAGRWRAAAEAYEAAAALPGFAELSKEERSGAYERLGACYHRLGLTQETIRALRAALEQDPADAGARYRLALAFSRSGRLEESLEALVTALQAAPGRERRKLVLLAKTDVELEPVRDLPEFRALVAKKG